MNRSLALMLLLLLVASGDPQVRRVQFDRAGIIRGDVSEKCLSLIFTAGDFAEGVPTILRVCADRDVPASFFVTGDFLRQHPAQAKSIIAAGHLLGPHSDQHLLYCDWEDREKSLVTRDQFTADLQKNLDDLKAIGAPPSEFFVPPFEWYNAEQVEWAKGLGLTLVNFTPGSGSNRDYIPEGDPKFASSEKLVEEILKYESTSEHGLNGFILLLHAGSKRQDKMHDHLDMLVDELGKRGYVFVTLDLLTGSKS